MLLLIRNPEAALHTLAQFIRDRKFVLCLGWLAVKYLQFHNLHHTKVCQEFIYSYLLCYCSLHSSFHRADAKERQHMFPEAAFLTFREA